MKKFLLIMLGVMIMVPANVFAQNKKITKLAFSNKLNRSMTVLDGPFKDLSLSGKATSQQIDYPCPQGVVQFTVKIYLDTLENSYIREVVSKIITEDMDTLFLKENDVERLKWKRVPIKLYNKTGYKIEFTGGSFQGPPLRAYKPWRHKRPMIQGRNASAIQFYDNKGDLVQANLEFIVAEGDKRIIITEKNIKNARAWDGYYSVIKEE